MISFDFSFDSGSFVPGRKTKTTETAYNIWGTASVTGYRS